MNPVKADTRPFGEAALEGGALAPAEATDEELDEEREALPDDETEEADLEDAVAPDEALDATTDAERQYLPFNVDGKLKSDHS